MTYSSQNLSLTVIFSFHLNQPKVPTIQGRSIQAHFTALHNILPSAPPTPTQDEILTLKPRQNDDILSIINNGFKSVGEIERPNVLFHREEKRLMLWNIYTPAIRPGLLKSSGSDSHSLCENHIHSVVLYSWPATVSDLTE